MNNIFYDLQTNPKVFFRFLRFAGLNEADFECLVHTFEREWDSYLEVNTLEGHPRARQKGVLRKNTIFKETKEVLLFVLLYLIGGVNQEQLAKSLGIHQSKVSKYLTLAKTILQRVLAGNPSLFSQRRRKSIQAAIIRRK